MSDSLDKQQKNTDKRLENLKPRWKKGESGNPNGRPKKGTAIADILNARGDEVDDDGLTNREIMLHKVYDKAVKHTDRWAVQFIADRTEGKAIERSVVSDEWKEVVKEAYKPES